MKKLIVLISLLFSMNLTTHAQGNHFDFYNYSGLNFLLLAEQVDVIPVEVSMGQLQREGYYYSGFKGGNYAFSYDEGVPKHQLIINTDSGKVKGVLFRGDLNAQRLQDFVSRAGFKTKDYSCFWKHDRMDEYVALIKMGQNDIFIFYTRNKDNMLGLCKLFQVENPNFE